jgi:hypothetical protein
MPSHQLSFSFSRHSSIPESDPKLSATKCWNGHCDLPEALHQLDVPLGVLDSREEKSMAVRREVGIPDGEKAGHVRNLVYLLSDKIEAVEGIVPRGAIEKVNAVSR